MFVTILFYTATYQDLKNYLVYTVGKFLLDADPPTTIQLPLTNPFDYNNEVIDNFGDERQQEALRIAVDTYYINFLLSSSIHLIIVFLFFIPRTMQITHQ